MKWLIQLYINMGGDTFEGVEKLTNQEYMHIVPEILDKLSQHYRRAEPYVPLPQKQIHGDIDFLIILKPGIQRKQLVQELQMETYILNKNDTINSVYKNKQIDFCFVNSDEQFEMMKFYKSYSGLGAYLGSFISSKEVKLSDKGLFAMGYKDHIKFQFLLTKQVPDILKFYGLDPTKYQAGFESRNELFDFLLDCRFLDVQKFKQRNSKYAPKITKFFVEYLNQNEIQQKHKEVFVYDNPKQQTLAEFNKSQQFHEEFEKMLQVIQKKQWLNKKFNATHIMQRFGVKSKQVNKLKLLFRKTFESQTSYEHFIENNKLETILEKFGEVLQQTKNEQKSEEKKEESSLSQGSETLQKQEVKQ